MYFRSLRLEPPISIEGASHISRVDIGLIILLLYLSGSPIFVTDCVLNRQMVWTAAALFLGFLLKGRSEEFFTDYFIVVGGLFGSLLLFQCLIFSYWPATTILGFYTRLFIGYATIRLVRHFPLAYVRAMYLLSLVSFLFYLPCLLLSLVGFDPTSLITHLSETLGTATRGNLPLIVHTFFPTGMERNAGIFWEPGAFSGYLVLAIIFLASLKDALSEIQYRKFFNVLAIALASTLSTTGYLIFPLLLVLHHQFSAIDEKIRNLRVLLFCFVLLPIFTGTAWYCYRTIPFLGEKFQDQLELVDGRRAGWETQRYGSLVFDWEYISQRPITGWGINRVTRYAMNAELIDQETANGNGMSDFIASFGIAGMLVWLAGTYWGMRRLIGQHKCVLAVLVLCLVLQGERFLVLPMFLGLMFLSEDSRIVV
ncbi:MAG: hypothetical protein WCJ35_18695 [Planctomycetota bacterium]